MNVFGEEFYQLYNENIQHIFFVDHDINLGDDVFSVVEFQPVKGILNNCYKIALEKARYTMNEGQNLQIRTKKRKIINQFKGIMAETAIHIYLHKRCHFSLDEIHRWDLERADFRDAYNEYDLKITRQGIDYFIESRSSGSYKTGLDTFMQHYDIIGKYSNRRKNNEKISDMYIRPVFQYLHPTMTWEEYAQAINNTFSDIRNNELKLFLVAVVGKEEMYGAKGYKKNLGQGNTIYQCIKIKDAHDISAIPAIYYRAMEKRNIR